MLWAHSLPLETFSPQPPPRYVENEATWDVPPLYEQSLMLKGLYREYYNPKEGLLVLLVSRVNIPRCNPKATSCPGTLKL